jgi:Ca-activated chloride channel homolog
LFTFTHSNSFSLLLIVPIIILLLMMHKAWRNKKIKQNIDEHLVKNIVQLESSKRSFLRNAIFIASLILIIFSLCGPVWGTQPIIQKQSNKEIIICLDLSNSMNTTDLAPTRLERAKTFINKWIDENTNIKIGLVVFAGNAYVSVPLTVDADAVKLNISAVNTEMAPTQGTAIGKALNTAHGCFNTNTTAGRAIVLITDGEDHEAEIDAEIKACNDDEIKTIVVGVGTIGGAQLYDTQTKQVKLDEEGNVVISKLNEKILNEIADVAQSNLIILNNVNDAVKETNAQLLDLTNAGTLESKINIHQQYFQYFLFTGILLLLCYFGFSFFKYKNNTK